MALSLRKTPGGTVGLDIDGRYLAAAQVNGQRAAASQALPDGLVPRSSTANGSRRLSRASSPSPAAANGALRGVEPADRRPRGGASAHRGREAARRRRPLPGRRGDRHAARRGCARPPGRRLPSTPDGTPRMQVVLVAARRSMIEGLLEAAKKARRRGRRPRRLRASSARWPPTDHRLEETARVYCHLSGEQPRDRRRPHLLLHSPAVGGLG